nr:uncharacterized protein LOC128688207 [Cherax quadricarinatus]
MLEKVALKERVVMLEKVALKERVVMLEKVALKERVVMLEKVALKERVVMLEKVALKERVVMLEKVALKERVVMLEKVALKERVVMLEKVALKERVVMLEKVALKERVVMLEKVALKERVVMLEKVALKERVHSALCSPPAHQDSADEYDSEAARVTAASTYLIEQLEPPPQYASRPPPHILPPPPSHNDLNMDDAYDDVRRNQYNAALDRAAAGYGTLGRRNTTPDHYNITAADDHYPLSNRYNTYQPPPAPLTPLASTQNNGSLRRNPPSKLHFPKDYIRNGSMNIPVSSSSSTGVGVGGGQYSSKPQSPTRAHPPPHTPMLSTFAPDAGQLSAAGVPLEHRGHLV